MDLEPHHDGDHLRVSDRERERIVELLGQATAEGRLTLDEYTDRVTEAYQAKTRGELARLTQDLPTTAGPGGPPASGTRRPAFPAPLGAPPPPPPAEKMIVIFGDETRTGRWLVPERVAAWSVFGDCKIELQEAQLQHQVTTIVATAIFGAMTVYVPEGVDVRLTGTAMFGEKTSKLRGPVRPGAPVIQIQCTVIFGSVTVRPPAGSV